MEIKPFKILCKNIAEREQVISILKENNFTHSEGIYKICDDALAIVVHNDNTYQVLDRDGFNIYTCVCGDEETKETTKGLSFTKFMKMYGNIQSKTTGLYYR